MKALALLVCGLLFLSTVAVADTHEGDGDAAEDHEQGSEDASHDVEGDGVPEDRCEAAYQERLVDANETYEKRLQDAAEDLEEIMQDENATPGERRQAQRDHQVAEAQARAEHRRAVASAEERFARCQTEERRGDSETDNHTADQDASFESDGRHISFAPDASNSSLADYTVGGVLALDRLQYLGNGTDPGAGSHSDGRALEVRWDDARLRLHDNPTGLVQARSDGGAGFLFDFADGAQITRTDNGARIQFGDRSGILVAPIAEWIDDDTVVVADFASFHMPVRAPGADRDSEPEERGRHIDDAVASRRVAAQVALGRPDSAPGGAGSSEVLVFDDVEVSANGTGSASDPYRVRIGAQLSEGRTIVLDIADVVPGQPIEVEYFDIHDDESRTQVVIEQASGLEDVLDPTDDEGQPEYWIVHDAGGAHVLVSIPHWSVHEVTVSIGEFIAQPSVIVGIVSGIFGAAVAATVMMWPRRQQAA